MDKQTREFLYESIMKKVNQALKRSKLVNSWDREYKEVPFKVELHLIGDKVYVDAAGDRNTYGFMGFFLVTIPSKDYVTARAIHSKRFMAGDGERKADAYFYEVEGKQYFAQAILLAERAIDGNTTLAK